MSRKTLVLFIGLLTAIIGLTLLRPLIKGSPLLIIAVSTSISILAALISVAWASKKRNHFLKEDEKILKSKLIDEKIGVKLTQSLYKISQKANIKTPQLTVFSSPIRTAYSYQISPLSSYIKFSDTLINNSCNKTLVGILAHEVSHIKNRDSWKSILRFINWVFVLSIFFFFIKHSSVMLIPIIVYLELSKLREKELESDLQAIDYTSFDNMLHGLLDNYLLQLMAKKLLWQDVQKAGLIYKFPKLIDAMKFELTLFLFKFLGTHPSWESRIKQLLKSRNIKMNDKEFNFFIKKILNYRQHYGFNRSIDWNKIGILAEKLK